MRTLPTLLDSIASRPRAADISVQSQWNPMRCAEAKTAVRGGFAADRPLTTDARSGGRQWWTRTHAGVTGYDLGAREGCSPKLDSTLLDCGRGISAVNVG